MRSVFDEEEEEQRGPRRRDRELILGAGTLFGIFVGLVVLCGLCFGMGYTLGHSSSGITAITPPQPAPDQEPLQASGSIPKPSAIAQAPDVPPAASPAVSSAATSDQSAAASGDSAGAPGQASPAAASGNPATPAQVHPALAVESVPQPAPFRAAPAVRSAMPSQRLMVQIAAISNPADAAVLVDALRKRNYPVSEHHEAGDDYIHVRLGPFTSRSVAEQWRMKLLNDGYNAVIQP